jgi:hypothetical protein
MRFMLLRDYEAMSPWPNLNFRGAARSLIPKGYEPLKLRIQDIRLAWPAGVHIILSWGAGDCLCRNVFKETKFAFAFYANRRQLIGKTLQEAGDVDIL